MTRSVGLFDHVGDDPTMPAVIYQLPPDGTVSIRVLNPSFQDLVNNDLKEGVGSKGKRMFPADGEAYLEALIARNATTSCMSWRELKEVVHLMDEDWEAELALSGGGLDPRNPCPKCGVIPHAPGDGSGRSCANCGWRWMVGREGGRYVNRPQDPISGRDAQVLDSNSMGAEPGEEDEHAALVREGARRYRWRVEDAAGLASGEARRTLRQLAKILAKAELDPAAVRLPGALLNLEAWRAIHADPRLNALLVNQYCLGLGSSRAPIVVMGTEAADDLGAPEELAYQCIFPVVLLTDSRADITDALLRLGNWTRPDAGWPLHLAPWDFFGKPSAGRNTWRLVAKAVSKRPYQELIGRGRAELGLGARAYQIERSAASALKARKGTPPSAERVDFITTKFLPSVAKTARVLLMHGFGGPWPVWNERSSQIATSFLGFDPELDWKRRPDLEIRRTDDGRAFIWSRALNFNVSDDLIEEIRATVLDAAPEP